MFTVVIPTYNRSSLVTRAIDSVYATGWEGVEIIVVDDASKDDTPEIIARRYPMVQVLRMPTNSGPSAARNVGIDAATARWVLMLDDDDLLVPDAFKTICRVLGENPELERYPVIQFAHTNAKMDRSFLVAGLTDYVEGRLQGDFAPLVQTRKFRSEQLRYPKSRIGGEGLLWFQIAQSWGLPSYAAAVIRLTDDAPTKLCSTRSQLARPREYAELQDETLALFGAALFSISPAYYRKKVIGGIVFRVLCGDRHLARTSITDSISLRATERFMLRCLSYMPLPVIAWLFTLYRGSGR